MACPLLNKEKHIAKNPRVTYFSTGPTRAAKPWCLRCGSYKHATTLCETKNLAILFPEESDKDDFLNVCLWCGALGHDLKECMKHAPILANENKQAIASLDERVLAVQKSTALVANLQKSIQELQSDMAGIQSWRKTTNA